MQQPLHVLRPGIAIGLMDEGEFAQEVRATEPMAAVLPGQIGRPAVMDDHPALARDDADGGHGLKPPLLMDELTRDVPTRADLR